MKNIWINEISLKKEIKHLLLLMKITFIILFICISQLQAVTSYAQNATISIEKKDVTLEELFNDIERRSEFLFNYRDSDVSHIKAKVSVKNGNINEVLTQALSNTDLSYSISDRHITIFKAPKIVKENKKIVTGNVKDHTGEFLLGVSIVLKGTSVGTVTDIDGNYSIEVPDDHAILVFSYLGYSTRELSVKEKNRIDVILIEDTQKLDEVVVVGFGTQKKVNLTGSVGTVNAESLESRPVQNAVQALQGMVPGLQISTTSGTLDKKMDMNIRGTGTIGEGSESGPLVLIDGMEGDINSINPQDIENISVLKDAAASSIYGSRAPFGVILVTTKRGKSGKATDNGIYWGLWRASKC